MNVADLGLPESFNTRGIDPALLTFSEYHALVNPQDKTHPNSAYDVDLKKLNSYLNQKSDFPKIIRRFRRHGLDFEIRLRLEKRGPPMKLDPDGLPLRIDGELQHYTEAEAVALGFRRHQWDLAVFEGDQKVAAVQDEWGTLLVMVAREYRGLGIGPMLVEIARSIEPGRSSGGFTPDGRRNLRKVHRAFVGEALRTGLYRTLIAQGSLTIARVKEIVASASGKPVSRLPNLEQDFSGDTPQNWLLYVGEHGDFVVYDRNLKDAIGGDERSAFFTERMIKGIAYAQLHDGHREEWAMLRAFGADTPGLRKFLMSCAVEYCRREGYPLYLEPAEYDALDPAMGRLGPPSKVRGFESREVIPSGRAVAYDPLGQAERAWRKQFDRYDEFRVQMLEMAYAKYGSSS